MSLKKITFYFSVPLPNKCSKSATELNCQSCTNQILMSTNNLLARHFVTKSDLLVYYSRSREIYYKNK